MSHNWSDSEFGFETRAIHAGQEPDPTTGAIMTPVYLTSTYVQESPGRHKGYEYSRSHNPTRKAYEICLANLEKGRFAFAMASGCAASTTVLHLLKTGDHVVASDDLYGGSVRLFEHVVKPMGVDVTYVNMTEPGAVEKAMRDNTKMVWFETPSNPLMRLIDIAEVAKVAKSKCALTVVDNTFMSPYFQNPLELGADLVVHSTTKYIGGHSDMVGGAIIGRDEDLAQKIFFLSNTMGAIASPFDSFMALRSLKTLSVRMREHEANAKKIAAFLEGHPKVERVLYPGLESHPQHALAKKQMRGFGGMMSMYIKGGIEETRRFLESLRVFALAESLGGVESLVNHPAIMTHASVPADRRARLGITDNLVRISVGIENVEDLIADLRGALR